MSRSTFVHLRHHVIRDAVVLCEVRIEWRFRSGALLPWPDG